MPALPPIPSSLGVSRRRFALMGAAVTSVLVGLCRDAVSDVFIRPVWRRKEFLPYRLAIPDFLSGTAADEDIAHNLAIVVGTNLRRNGFEAAAAMTPANGHLSLDSRPQFEDWQKTGADALVVGRVTTLDDRKLRTEFRLWAVATGSQLTGQRYISALDEWLRVGHIVSDVTFERLTGMKGHFEDDFVHAR